MSEASSHLAPSQAGSVQSACPAARHHQRTQICSNAHVRKRRHAGSLAHPPPISRRVAADRSVGEGWGSGGGDRERGGSILMVKNGKRKLKLIESIGQAAASGSYCLFGREGRALHGRPLFQPGSSLPCGLSLSLLLLSLPVAFSVHCSPIPASHSLFCTCLSLTLHLPL